MLIECLKFICQKDCINCSNGYLIPYARNTCQWCITVTWHYTQCQITQCAIIPNAIIPHLFWGIIWVFCHIGYIVIGYFVLTPHRVLCLFFTWLRSRCYELLGFAMGDDNWLDVFGFDLHLKIWCVTSCSMNADSCLLQLWTLVGIPVFSPMYYFLRIVKCYKTIRYLQRWIFNRQWGLQ